MKNNSRTEITKDNAVKILRSNFDKIPKHRYFDTTNCCVTDIQKNRELNREYDLCIKVTLLLAHKNNDTEALILLNNNTYNKYQSCNNDYMNVGLSPEMIKLLSRVDTDETYTAFHNHTTDNTFSIKDIICMLSYERINSIVVVTNSCKYIAIMTKPNSLSNTSKLLIKCTEKIIQFLMDSHVITGHERANYIFPILKKCQFYYKEYTNF